MALVVGGLISLACAAQEPPPPPDAPEETQRRITIPIGPSADRTLFARAVRPIAAPPTFALPQRRRGGLELPANRDLLAWGVGWSVDRPVAGDDPLGAGTWSAGLASVALAIHGARLYGVLGSHRCALAGSVDGGGMYGLVIQPYVNYNLPDGWYLMSVPVISADWLAPGSQRWTVPMGAGIGRSTRLRDMPLAVQAGYYYNVEKPDGAPDWMLRLELQLQFGG